MCLIGFFSGALTSRDYRYVYFRMLTCICCLFSSCRLALQVALPHMGEAERFEVRQLKGHCVYEVTCLFGFRDTITQDRPFIQKMLCKICEDIRYRAMAAR